ncbi:hypothetical protein V2J09_013128 [Rumex salicifolius]
MRYQTPTPLSQISPAFILPYELRPRHSDVSSLSSIPVIDLGQDEGEDGLYLMSVVENVSRACEEYGFFQVINHGVPDQLCADMLDAIKELFEVPPIVKEVFFSDDPKEARLFRRHLNVPGSPQDKVSMWSEAFFHPWHPSHQDFTAVLPSDPPKYRAVIAEYAMEISKLHTRLLSLISLGLGLDKDNLQKRHGQSPRRRAQANYYPPCPDPELTLGLAPHTDLNTLTLLQQSGRVSGLQVIKDGEWVSVDPVPKAFVVNVGDQLQVFSNGRFKSVHHRAVTNECELRVSMAVFFGPDEDTVVGPIEELISKENPALYRSYRYKEYVQEFHRQDGTRRRVKEAFELQR